jgi:excinuclease UvrABC nuclease subunit
MADWMRMFDGCLPVAPPLGEEHLREIPAKRGVFALLADDDKPIVLLTGADIRGRIRHRLQHPEPDHRGRTADLRQITRKVVYKLAGSYFETDLQYLEIARKMHPRAWRSLVAWKPAWFAHVDPAEPFPHFARTRDVFAAAGRYFGPFPSGRDAGAFVDALQDAFDLCRDIRCLRQAPHAQPCPYLQMNRCLGPCCGEITMEAYREVIARAADFAAGQRETFRAELKQQMAAASKSLAFEKAASVKTRLERLGGFDSPAYRHVAPAEAFRFLLVQQGLSRREARVFLVDRGHVAAGRDMDYPLQARQLAGAVARMTTHCSRPKSDDADPWRMGLVARYLRCSDQRRGLILRWDDSVTPEALGEAIEASKDDLKLRAPKKRKKKEEDTKPQAGADAS